MKISDELWQRLASTALELGTTRTELIRVAIEQVVATESERRLSAELELIATKRELAAARRQLETVRAALFDDVDVVRTSQGVAA